MLVSLDFIGLFLKIGSTMGVLILLEDNLSNYFHYEVFYTITIT